MNELDFGKRSNGKQHGVVLTKPEVVEAMLDLVGYCPTQNLNGIRIVEPAAGDGAFALEILRRLHQSSLEFGFDFESAMQDVHFYEIDPTAILRLCSHIADLFAELGCDQPFPNVHHQDYLTSELRSADLVVGNPPYVRYDNIPEVTREKYKSQYATFRFRSDLYILFYEKGLSQLNDSGKLAFICADRWLKSQYGRPLRELISMKYHLEMVIDLTQTQPFQEDVMAYPAITVLSNRRNQTASRWHQIPQLASLSEIVEKHRRPERMLTIGHGSDDWFGPIQAGEAGVKCRLELIEKQNFSIGIGVATGCDHVFIGSHLKESVEQELLLPIISGRDLKGDDFVWRGEYLLNPFDENGNLIELGQYPSARNYLMAHEDVLKRRHVSQKRPEYWYRTIDKVQGSLLKQPKILLPDISGNRMIFIDEGKYYPHHNTYYITGGSMSDLKVMAAFLMSDFVRGQLETVGNKMNGGYPRWQCQNLRKLQVPQVNSLSIENRAALIDAYATRNYDGINAAMATILRSGQARLAPAGQLELFSA